MEELKTRRDDLGTIVRHMREAEEKAIDALARYKFTMFGYWAGVWVHMNKLTKDMGYHGSASPFGFLVNEARVAREKAVRDASGHANSLRQSSR